MSISEWRAKDDGNAWAACDCSSHFPPRCFIAAEKINHTFAQQTYRLKLSYRAMTIFFSQVISSASGWMTKNVSVLCKDNAQKCCWALLSAWLPFVRVFEGKTLFLKSVIGSKLVLDYQIISAVYFPFKQV